MTDVDQVARAIYQTLHADKGHFLLLAMNNKNRVNGFKVVSTGSLTASLVHPVKCGVQRFTFAQLRWCLFTTIRAATPHQVKKTKKSLADEKTRPTC